MTSFVVLHISSTNSKLADGLRTGVASLGALSSLELGAFWVVESEAMADEIRDTISARLPKDDAVIVFGVGEQAAWSGLPSDKAEWLADHL